ncbi:hypothetical protein [Planktotalea arctica]|uniref:hypothetical protein n=1 Tax=Planktotalea arctica TaxID=1481893 RepID=UPI001592FE1D|nr:hypothetical protein [Planktotalea arctica]
MVCSFVGLTATAAAFMAPKEGRRGGPAPAWAAAQRRRLEAGSFGSRWKGGSAAAGKEPGAGVAGPFRLPSGRPPKKAGVARPTELGAPPLLVTAGVH